MRLPFSPAIALPGCILAVIFLMVLPIPPLMLDVFFVLNIALSIAVLMAAINAGKPLDFSSFPSVLLFATLLRLALNVASTRVVLMNGHGGGAAAGQVIEAFGAFLIGGDFVVGLFVFLILMIINLVVVTKGAGRVSEVSARFTLDALPGKQMAIDADLAAGLITSDEARTRRSETATEADFYGSMDGASKFVKGDAVAALLILGVNIIAGLVLGMVSHGLSLSEAGEIYVTLAVGDALVASIPALLLSIAAAIIVTRVTDARDLSGQIGGQFSDRRIWLPVAAIMFAMGCIPAMPQTVFLPFAALAFIAWRKLSKLEEAKHLQSASGQDDDDEADPLAFDIADVTETALITVELGYGLVHLADERKGAPLVARLAGLRKLLSETLGFVIPQFRVRDSFACAPGEYRILIGGAPMGSAELRPDRLLAINTGDVVPDGATAGDPTRDPSFGCEAIWIVPADRTTALAEGYLVVEPENVLATHLNQILLQYGHKLCGPTQVAGLLELLKRDHAPLVEAVTPQPLSLGALTRVLRALVEDGVTLSHPLSVFNALSQAVQMTSDHDQIVDSVRASLGERLTATIVAADQTLPVITLAPELEQMVVGGMADPATGRPILDPELARSIGAELARVTGEERRAALIVQPRARRPLAQAVRARASNVEVLSIHELPPQQPIEVIAIIGGAGAGATEISSPPEQEVLAA